MPGALRVLPVLSEALRQGTLLPTLRRLADGVTPSVVLSVLTHDAALLAAPEALDEPPVGDAAGVRDARALELERYAAELWAEGADAEACAAHREVAVDTLLLAADCHLHAPLPLEPAPQGE